MTRRLTPKQYAAERGVSVQYIGRLLREIELAQQHNRYTLEDHRRKQLMTCGTGPKVTQITIEKIVRWRSLTVTTE